ncbi:hypothetical protein Tco_0842617 [Tanacetum coccineum]|uniref:Uncharacterized protein n=1 Tax=Tanacetum coccineum TaxID=301880 RepID=A0ABQ5B099_9ASTR
MVAYLKKTEGGEGFHQIVDFANTSHIRYALTKNSTIYLSLIQQFWQTATASTLDNGDMEITATIDGKVKTVSEASQGPVVQGEESTHPVESHHTPTSAPPTSQPPISLTSRRITRQESVVTQPRSPTQTNVADEAASTGVDVRLGRATTTITGLEARHSSGNIDKTPVMPHDSPLPRVNTLGRDEGKIQGRHEHDMESDFEFTAAEEVYTTKKGVSTTKPVSTVGASVSTASASTAKDKALRFQEQLDEEERQRIARVHEAASSFNIKDWEDIQARIEADEELAQSYTLQQLRGYLFDKIKSLFKATMKRVNTFTPMESDVDRTVPKIATGSSKRDAKEELDQESSKRQKIVPEQGMNVEALQTKYLIIDWEIYTEGTRKYWKIIRVGNHTEVELKRLFEPDIDDELWKIQKHIHDLSSKLYDSCGVHHVSTEKGIDIYMLIEKEYPLLRGVLTLMLVAKLLVEQDNEMSRELLRKIFMQVERPRR